MTRALLAGIVVLLSGCGFLTNPTTRLWTDSVEVAVYVENYNAADNPYRVEVEFLEDPPRELAIRTDPPDVVIAGQLASATVRPFLGDLSRLLEGSALSPDSFYAELLDLGRFGDEQRALPLSFNLPLIMFHRERGLVNPARFGVTPSEMQEIGGDYNDSVGERFVRMGFSPRWDPRFLVALAQLRGAAFRETAPHEMRWHDPSVAAVLEETNTWIVETNGGAEAENEFESRYLYDPFLKLLSSGRIGAMYATSREYYEIPESQRRQFAYSWLWDGTKIPVLGTVLYAGIPTDAANRRGADHFVRWLLDPAVQAELIRTAPQKRIRSFGFAGGFSSLPHVNLNVLAFRYESLIGALPQPELLAFPHVLPTYWDELSEEVIEPWMNRAVQSDSPPTLLADLVDAWLLTRGE